MSAPRFIACFAVACCLTSVLATAAIAQYMYLDSNGNGVNDPGDAVNGIGVPTTVDLYVTTNRNRDGSEVPCATSNPSQNGHIVAYTVNLLAVDGAVTYSNFINRQPAFGLRFNEFNPGDGARYQTGFLTLSGPRLDPGGPHRMATLTVTAQSGSPRI